ncbi:hypothetical protein CC78DRAFT_580979 [Lojkania enalia]|uniref:Uncharacterized protein n=1 Tax=Lojkania enalia TaxID=147567 RepID=A0A9P4N3R9_9PLEO|nr:hypothetical protein CC78DRAFT_580979 [Didymosphaeria enalia]
MSWRGAAAFDLLARRLKRVAQRGAFVGNALAEGNIAINSLHQSDSKTSRSEIAKSMAKLSANVGNLQKGSRLYHCTCPPVSRAAECSFTGESNALEANRGSCTLAWFSTPQLDWEPVRSDSVRCSGGAQLNEADRICTHSHANPLYSPFIALPSPLWLQFIPLFTSSLDLLLKTLSVAGKRQPRPPKPIC